VRYLERGLLSFDGLQMKGDGAPEEPGLHLDREVTSVIGVPDPDVAAILNHALVGGWFYFDGLERACGCLYLFASLGLHANSDGAHGICEREVGGLAGNDGLRLLVKDGRERIRDAGGNVGVLARGGAFDQVALVLGLLAVLIVEGKLAGNLAAAFLNLLVEAGGTTGVDVEAGLEAVDYGKEHVHGTGGVSCSGDPLDRAALLELEDSSAGSEDAPIDSEGEGLMQRVSEACSRRSEGGNRALRGSGLRSGKNLQASNSLSP